MLKLFRKNTKTIIWIVVLSFVVWGGYSVGSQFEKRGRYAGEVFGKSVTFQEFDLFYRSVQLFSFGQNKSPDAPEIIRQQAWQSLILSRQAKREKISVPDQEVREEIFRLMRLQKIENPTPEIYQSWLKATIRETPQAFESQIRELLRIQKLVQKINGDPVATPSGEDLKKMFLRDEQKINLEALIFKTLEDAKNFSLKVKDAKSWKKEADALKLTPSATSLISLETLSRQWGIPEDKALALWNLGKGKFSEPMGLRGQFAVFYVLDKQSADEKKFDKPAQEKYAQQFSDKQKYERFILWNQKIFLEAGLKDYQDEKT